MIVGTARTARRLFSPVKRDWWHCFMRTLTSMRCRRFWSSSAALARNCAAASGPAAPRCWLAKVRSMVVKRGTCAGPLLVGHEVVQRLPQGGRDGGGLRHPVGLLKRLESNAAGCTSHACKTCMHAPGHRRPAAAPPPCHLPWRLSRPNTGRSWSDEVYTLLVQQTLVQRSAFTASRLQRRPPQTARDGTVCCSLQAGRQSRLLNDFCKRRHAFVWSGTLQNRRDLLQQTLQRFIRHRRRD